MGRFRKALRSLAEKDFGLLVLDLRLPDARVLDVVALVPRRRGVRRSVLRERRCTDTEERRAGLPTQILNEKSLLCANASSTPLC